MRRTSGRGSHLVMVVAAVAVSVGLVACTVLLDRNAPQCKNDGDCARFSGNYPVCSNGVCVSSGLVPDHCFMGTPEKPEDFLNACTHSACILPPDCLKDGTCSDPDGGLIPPTAPDAGAPADAGTSSDGGQQLPSCMDPVDRPLVIYITGSSNFPPLLAKLGPLIYKNTGYTAVYQITSSCNGVKSMFGTGRDHFIADPGTGSKTAAATYVTPEGALVPCALGSTGSGGVRVDIGESDIFATSCPTSGVPNPTVGEYYGPNQAMLFVVPSNSTQKVISAEMARTVFGRGGDHGISLPWTNPDLYLVRNANTGTQQMMGRAINVPAEQFWGKDQGSAKNLAAQLVLLASASAGNSAEPAIGLLSNDFYDDKKGNLTALFFQGFGQRCGFLPDSTPFVKDKQNVRDGHYPMWGPLHFFASINSEGVPVSLAARQFVSVVSEPDLDQELLDAYIGSGLVPSCAMHVQRLADLGPLTVFRPPVACNCYFENRLINPNGGGTPPADCTTCNFAGDCRDPNFPACQFNFCEAAN